MQVIAVSPERPKGFEELVWEAHLKRGIEDAEIVMALRVQNERGPSSENWKAYQLNKSHLGKRLFMAPGPVNWGVELHEELQGHAQSLIMAQVAMGLRVRSALLETFLSS
jgi:aspartate carbamoyltransferase catalytic subunit